MSRFKLVSILFIQLCLFLYISTQKHGYQCDELWTFNISNSEHVLYDESTPFSSYINKQLDKQLLNNFFCINPNSSFDLSIPWKNSFFDPHPPLYYCVIHLFSSIFSFINNGYDFYIGFFINLIFFVFTQLFIYFISKEVLKDSSLHLIPIFLYGFSLCCIDSVLIIRMYSMLTTFTCCFFYLHILLIKQIISKNNIDTPYLIYIFIVFILGFLTQLYFLIFAFFTCFYFFVLLLMKKHYFIVAKYTTTMFFSFILSILLCRDILIKIFGTNQHAVHISNSLLTFDFIDNFFEWIFILDKHTYIASTFMVLFAFLLLFSICKHHSNKINDNFFNVKQININIAVSSLSLYIAIVVLSTIAIISKITLFTSPRYIIFISPLCFVFLISMLGNNIPIVFKNKNIIFLAVVLFMILNISQYKNIMWLNFEQKNLIDILDSNNSPEKMLIIVKKNILYEGGGEPWWPTITALQLSCKIKKTCIIYIDDIEKINNTYVNDKNLLVCIDSRIKNEFLDKIFYSLQFKNKKLLHEFDEHQGKIFLLSK